MFTCLSVNIRVNQACIFSYVRFCSWRLSLVKRKHKHWLERPRSEPCRINNIGLAHAEHPVFQLFPKLTFKAAQLTERMRRRNAGFRRWALSRNLKDSKHIQEDSETLLQHRHTRPYLTQLHNNMKNAFSMFVCFLVIEGKCLNPDLL